MVVREFINLIGFKVNQAQYAQAEKVVGKLTTDMRNIGIMGSVAITAPFVALSGWLIKNASYMEDLTVAFTTMLGSADTADTLIKDMFSFAAKTPFKIGEIGDSVKQLLAMGSTSETVLDDLKMLGDVAAGLNVPISRLGLNFGQVRVQSKLTGRELKDFSVSGVPLLDELAKMLGKSKEAIMEMTSSGKISFEDVKEAFRRMTTGSGKFADLMIKKSKTLSGIWSNFQDMLTLTAMEIGAYLIPAVKKLVLWFLKISTYLKEKVTPELKLILFWMFAFTAAIPPLILALSTIIFIGSSVAKAWGLMTLAASAHNVTVAAIVLKYILLAAAFVAVSALIAILIEDFILYTQGQESMMGKILPSWDELKRKIVGVYDAMEEFGASMHRSEFVKGMIDGWIASCEEMGAWLHQFTAWLWDDWIKGWEYVGMLISRTVIALEKFTGLFKTGITGTELTYSEIATLISSAKSGSSRERITSGIPTIPSREPSSTINVNSSITTYVPVGTNASQIDAIRNQAEKSVSEVFSKELRNLILSTGGVK